MYLCSEIVLKLSLYRTRTTTRRNKNKTKRKSNLKYFALISNVYSNSLITVQIKKETKESINSWKSIGEEEVGGGRTST